MERFRPRFSHHIRAPPPETKRTLISTCKRKRETSFNSLRQADTISSTAPGSFACKYGGAGQIWIHCNEGMAIMTESQEALTGYFFITDSCIGCGTCVEWCPTEAIEEGSPYHIQPDECIGCGLCCDTCPTGAIEALA